LRNNQWVCWWWRNTVRYVWLEVYYACMCEVDVISPSCYYWIGFNASVTLFLEKG
jgi:hypothetical protein